MSDILMFQGYWKIQLTFRQCGHRFGIFRNHPSTVVLATGNVA